MIITTKSALTLIVLLLSFSSSNAQETSALTLSKTKEYTCTMHPEVVSNNPEFCPKCGMKLIEKESTVKTEMLAETYTCSMHPEVISESLGKCPKCGMDLIVKGETSSSDMDSMGMMHSKKKHKRVMQFAGGALMVGMMVVLMVLATH